MEEHRFSVRLCGFVHVPFLPEQVPVPSMEFARMWIALGAILKAVATEIAFRSRARINVPELGCQDVVRPRVSK